MIPIGGGERIRNQEGIRRISAPMGGFRGVCWGKKKLIEAKAGVGYHRKDSPRWWMTEQWHQGSSGDNLAGPLRPGKLGGGINQVDTGRRGESIAPRRTRPKKDTFNGKQTDPLFGTNGTKQATILGIKVATVTISRREFENPTMQLAVLKKLGASKGSVYLNRR